MTQWFWTTVQATGLVQSIWSSAWLHMYEWDGRYFKIQGVSSNTWAQKPQSTRCHHPTKPFQLSSSQPSRSSTEPNQIHLYLLVDEWSQSVRKCYYPPPPSPCESAADDQRSSQWPQNWSLNLSKIPHHDSSWNANTKPNLVFHFFFIKGVGGRKRMGGSMHEILPPCWTRGKKLIKARKKMSDQWEPT